MGKIYDLGIDVGSTTVKTVILDEGEFIYNKYERHFSKVRETVAEQLRTIRELYPDDKFKIAITGSAGLGIAEASGISFVQEVFSAFIAVNKKYPKADVVVELGGEDAKIIFLTGGVEQRMNGSCAGGTGAFIDQMAGLLGVTPDEMNDLALKAEKTYPIASRCGVFAKSDIQPLLNQGAFWCAGCRTARCCVRASRRRKPTAACRTRPVMPATGAQSARRCSITTAARSMSTSATACTGCSTS